MRAARGADDGGRLAVERALTPRAGRPVERVLEHAGDRAAVLGGHDDDAVDVLDRLLEVARDLRVVGVVVDRVERQVLDRDLDEGRALGRETLERLREAAVDRGRRDAADDVADGAIGHAEYSSKKAKGPRRGPPWTFHPRARTWRGRSIPMHGNFLVCHPRRRSRRTRLTGDAARAGIRTVESSPSEGDTMLQLTGITKSYGSRPALDDVSFDVRPGRLTGFVGGNGAGKTTTMRIILGVLAKDAGTVTLDGAEVTASDRRRFGYMPEERGLYPKMKVLEQIVYLARLHGFSKSGCRDPRHRTARAARTRRAPRRQRRDALARQPAARPDRRRARARPRGADPRRAVLGPRPARRRRRRRRAAGARRGRVPPCSSRRTSSTSSSGCATTS